MASNFLEAALDLLGRPGNAVRGALIGGPQGALQGLTGDRQFDPTELPGINQLPDEGPQLGPLHLTPRTIAGFAGSALLDPLSYAPLGAVGAGLGHAGAGLLERLGSRAAPELDLLGRGSELTPELSGVFQGGVTHPHFQVPTSDSILGGFSSPEAAEQAVAQDTGSEAARTSGSYRPGGPREQTLPDSEVTPVGDQKYAQARDRLESRKSDLNVLKNKAGTAEDWLDYTSTAEPQSTAKSWEDVVGVNRGTRPEDALAKQESSDVDYSRGSRDLSQGPGLTSQYPVNGQMESVGFSRNEVMNHVRNLQAQIDELTHTLSGDRGSRFGDPLERRGMENTLSDWQARRQIAADPSLANTERQSLMRTSTSSRPGLSEKQEQLAQRKTGQQLSRDETFRRAPDSSYYNRGTPGAAPDEANMDLTAERDTRAPHADPLEEERALKAQDDKFGRKGAGTFQSSDELGMDENARPGGLRDTTDRVGVVDHLGRDTATDPRAMPVPSSRTTEMTADAGNSQDVQLAIERIRTEWILNALRNGLYRGSSTIANYPK